MKMYKSGKYSHYCELTGFQNYQAVFNVSLLIQ